MNGELVMISTLSIRVATLEAVLSPDQKLLYDKLIHKRIEDYKKIYSGLLTDDQMEEALGMLMPD